MSRAHTLSWPQANRSAWMIAHRCWRNRRRRPGTAIPILGAKTLSQVQDNLRCLEFELATEQLQRLEAISHIDLGFTHDFLALPGVRKVIYGKTLPLIDSGR